MVDKVMFNYVVTKLIVSGSQEYINSLIFKVKGKKSSLDFNSISPNPTQLEAKDKLMSHMDLDKILKGRAYASLTCEDIANFSEEELRFVLGKSIGSSRTAWVLALLIVLLFRNGFLYNEDIRKLICAEWGHGGSA